MKLEGRFRIAAPRAAVFEKLNDPHFFASCLEGVHDLQEIDEDNYTAVLETRIAYINFKFDVAVSIKERVAPERVVVHLEGTPKGMVGRLTTEAVARLSDADHGAATDISYEMDLALTGKLGSLGQPVMRSKAKEMERSFVRRASAAFAPAPSDSPQFAPTGTAARKVAQGPGRPGRMRLWIAALARSLASRLLGDQREGPAPSQGPFGGGRQELPQEERSTEAPRPPAGRSRLDFDLVRPASVADAIAILDRDDPTIRPYSGGTALMLMMKSGVFSPTILVDLTALEKELGGIAVEDGSVRIGSLATLASLGTDASVAKCAPAITRAIPRLSNVRVRNAARVGGCMAHGDPHMDLPPILASLRAEVEIQGPEGVRRLPVEDLYTGYYQTTLAHGELIAAARLPVQSGWRSVYRKTTVRTYDDWPALGVAVSARIEDGVIGEARVVVSAATEKVTRITGLEPMLAGTELTEKIAAEAGEYTAFTVETLDDVQGTAAYKKVLLEVEVRRALLALLDEEAVA